MYHIEMKPGYPEEKIVAVVKSIAGVEPNINILHNSRVSFTIDAELTIRQRKELAQKLSELPHHNWAVSIS